MILTHAYAMLATAVKFGTPLWIIACLCANASAQQEPARSEWPQYSTNPFVIPIDIPAPKDSAGGLIAVELDADGRMDFLVTVPGHIAAYDNSGDKLWILNIDVRVAGSSERVGLPGHNGPGVQAGDIDGDGDCEVLFITQDSVLHVVDGATGKQEWIATPSVPAGAERWEHLVVANFRGEGDRDILLQATNKDGYRMGRYLAAYSLLDLREGRDAPIWKRDDFVSCAHNGARVADLDSDGKDEVIGPMILAPDGSQLVMIPLKGHIDSVFIRDVRPDIPGYEVVALEEGGGNRVFLYNHERVLWESNYNHWEPQNAAVGDFDPSRPGLEIWCRSRFNTHQKPFVFDARGEIIAAYEMDNVAPDGWTAAGVEVINTIDWTGAAPQLAVAKERHKEGDVAIFDGASGQFLRRFSEKASRLYVADVAGDWREEFMVLNGSELHIYHNDQDNPNPDRERLWEQNPYRRSKMTWNYYSP